MKGLLEEGDAVPLHRVKARGGGLDVLAEDLPAFDQQNALGSQSLAGRLDVEDVAGEGLAEGRPAELGRAESRSADVGGAGACLLRRRAEQHRSVRQLRISLGVTQSW